MNKNTIDRSKYILAGDASGNVVGDWINLAGLDNVSFQAVWTGTPTGAFLFEVSNDAPASDTTVAGKPTTQPDGRLGPSALTLPASMTVAAAIPSGTAGDFYFDFNEMSAHWIRMSFISTSGTGALSVGAFGKDI